MRTIWLAGVLLVLIATGFAERTVISAEERSTAVSIANVAVLLFQSGHSHIPMDLEQASSQEDWKAYLPLMC